MKKQTINVVSLTLCIATSIQMISAQVCSEYGFFCETCTTVKICQSGVPTAGVSLNCPSGYFCDQNSTTPCTKNECTNEPYPFFECQVPGAAAWIYNCSQYVWCVYTTGTLIPLLIDCPLTTVFNPNIGTCDLETSYKCVAANSTTATTTTAAPETTESTIICSSYARIAITTDATCRSYYLCYPNTNGTFTLFERICPTTTVFNPTTAKCVLPTTYNCKN